MLNTGDILYTHWGYEQTNAEFYQIIRATEKTVWVQEIHSQIVTGDSWSGEREPMEGMFKDEPVIKRKIKNYGEPYIAINDVVNAYLHTPGQAISFSTWA